MYWLHYSLVLLLMVYSGSSVDKSKFKTCDQSSFCRRCRGMEAGKSVYEADLDSVKVSGEFLTADLIDTDSQIRFKLHLSALHRHTLRLQIIEAQPQRHRYYPSSALDGEPLLASELKLLDKKENQVVVEFAGHKVVLQGAPFRLDVLDKQTPILSLNPRGLFRFEHTRSKPSDEEVLKQEQEAGMWEENFSSHHDSKPHGPTAVALDFSFYGAKAAYGLPEHADSLALRTTTKGSEPYRFYNLDVFEYELDSPMALYAAVPLLYAHSETRTVGMWWLNPSETWVDLAVEGGPNVVSSLVSLVSGADPSTSTLSTHFMSEAGDLDVFIFLGPSPADVAKQYITLTGLPPIPPMFSLGYHQSRWNYNSQDDVDQVHHNFDLHDIPMDVIWLDIEHTDNKKYFTWDPYKFSDPVGMQQNLTAKGRKLVVIVDPHIKRESGYFLHDDATSHGYYVKNKDNSDYEGWCWPGSSSYLDLFNPDVQDYYSSRYHLDKYQGSTRDLFLWNDMNEPSVFNGPEVTMPKDNLHYGNWEHREVHNLYGLYQVMGTYRGLLERSGTSVEDSDRPFILTRSAFSGSQRYTAIWTGDNAAEWSHLKASIPMCLSLALAGFSHCGADVGGFFGNPAPELLVRWYQTGAWLPFYRGHAHIDTKRREPWLFGEDTTQLIRSAVRQRYSYLPLWYTLFQRLNSTGEPVIRPLFYHYPNDTNTFAMDDQLLIGDSLLVRPVTEAGVTQVSVYFPAGDSIWYDVDTFQKLHEGYYNLQVTPAKVPVFQRGGAIVPKKDRVRRSTPLMRNDPYTLVVALDPQGQAEGELYVDDETTHRFKYRSDASALLHFDFDGNTLSAKLVGEKQYKSAAWLERVVIVGTTQPATSATLTTGRDTSELKTTYDAAKKMLTIRKPGQKIAQNWSITLNH